MFRLLLVLAALLATLSLNAQATVVEVGGESGNYQYRSPREINAMDAMTRSGSASSSARCKDFVDRIGQATASPDVRNLVTRRIGPDGRPRNELRAYDKRADIEAESRRLGCW
jgi:hypothetical protein